MAELLLKIQHLFEYWKNLIWIIGKKTIVKELINDRTAARRLSNINASIKANVELAKLHGLYDQHNRQKKLPEMDMDQLVARAKELIDIVRVITINDGIKS